MKRIKLSKPLPDRVTVIYAPNEDVIMVQRGEQVSLIKWSDGRTQFLSNEHLVED